MSAYVPIDRAIECVASRTDVEDLKFCLASPPNLVDEDEGGSVEADSVDGVAWTSARRTVERRCHRVGNGVRDPDKLTQKRLFHY